jgi:processive 1,2-diacylglycerol beta-glucosyltransferase
VSGWSNWVAGQLRLSDLKNVLLATCALSGMRRPLFMSRVLILTAGYGEGHNAAARSLAEGIRAVGAFAEVRDVLLEAYGHKQETARRLYLQCIDRAPLLWAAIYRAMEWRAVAWATMRSLWLAESRLRAIIDEEKPDVVASVYPAYGHMLDRLFPGERPFLEYTIITDSISVNSIWFTRRADAYIVANEQTARIVRARLPKAKVEPLGFPVGPVFFDKRPSRNPPGGGERLRVLFMVNHAKKGVVSLVRDLLEIPHIHLTVTVGRDAALGRELAAAAAVMKCPLDVLGWVRDMPGLLMSHHVLIGKAGGAATQEALAAHTPMLITQIVPGQEEGNAQLILESECGALATTPAMLRETLQELAAGDFALWRKWAECAVKLGRPDSARSVARSILKL